MRVVNTGPNITDLVWDAQPGAHLRRTLGTWLMIAGLAVLAFGLLPGQTLPRLYGVDSAFIACAAVVGGLLLLAFAMARSRTRRVRVDRDARQLEIGVQDPNGSWFTYETMSFDTIIEVRVDAFEGEDATLYTLEILRAENLTTKIEPLAGLEDRNAVEAGLAALKAAIAGT